MISIRIQPMPIAVSGHDEEFDELKQCINALTETRKQHQARFLDELKSNEELEASITDGNDAIKKFKQIEAVQQIDREIERVLARMNVISNQAVDTLNIPIVGRDEIANQFVEEKHRDMQQHLNDLNEEDREFWGKPFEEYFKMQLGNAVLEVAPSPEALPAFISNTLKSKKDPTALVMDKLFKLLPELKRVFNFDGMRLLTDDELDTLQISLLHKFPDSEKGQQIVRYLVYWTSRGHDFLVIMEPVFNE